GVMNSWIREAHPDAPTHAGYMVLVNVAREPLGITAITSADYETIEVHEMSSDSGMMKMRRIEEVVIPADGLFKLEPGAKHLMLKNPKR
ncbi:MAG: copper chaperone PCu(A)C, partial [Wenzhouxiangellaceae bacterium]